MQGRRPGGAEGGGERARQERNGDARGVGNHFVGDEPPRAGYAPSRLTNPAVDREEARAGAAHEHLDGPQQHARRRDGGDQDGRDDGVDRVAPRERVPRRLRGRPLRGDRVDGGHSCSSSRTMMAPRGRTSLAPPPTLPGPPERASLRSRLTSTAAESVSMIAKTSRRAPTAFTTRSRAASLKARVSPSARKRR